MPSFRRGGSEKNIAFILNNLSREKFKIDCIVIYDDLIEYELARDIKLIFLQKKSLRTAVLNIYCILRNSDYDAVFSNMPFLNIANSVLSLFIKSKYRVICRESILISQYLKYEVRISLVWKLFIYFTYYNCDLLIAQCEEMKVDILNNFKIDKDKVVVIGNPITIKAPNRKIDMAVKPIRLVAMGRLVHQKGFDILINSISMIRDADVILTIVGSGVLEKSHLSLVKNLDLENKVSFVSSVDNVDVFLSGQDIFCTTSRYEGFPNVVLEALSCGLIICSTGTVTGIREIYELNKSRVFISCDDTAESFAERLNEIINNTIRRSDLNLGKWDKDRIISKYNSLLC